MGSCISTLQQFSRDTMKLFCVSLALCLGLMTSVSGQGGFFSNFINTANRFNPFNNRRPPSRPSVSRPPQPSAPTFSRPSSSSFSQPRPSSGSVINEIPAPSLGQQQSRPEDCLAILNNFYNDGVKFHDVGCSHTKPTVCEA